MPIVAVPPMQSLPLDQGHVMAWASVGDVRAPPVLILHGGPGGRSRAASLQWFAGVGLRCIVYDQRGCGASTPAGALAHNHTAALVADIERLREHLGLDAWAVAGGSWGALLAVMYAGLHPQRVRGLMLRSAFLGTAAEVAGFFAHWPRWVGTVGAPHADPLAWLDHLATAGAPAPALGHVGAAWNAYEQAQARPGGLAAMPAATWQPGADAPMALPPGLQVQQHYLRHGCFIGAAEREACLAVLDGALARRPSVLVHGQADAVCDIATSRTLAARWAGAVLDEVLGAGHAMDHPALNAALTDAAARWAARWRG